MIVVFVFSSPCVKPKKKKTPQQLPVTKLVPEVDIFSFYEGVSTVQEFTGVVCTKINSLLDENFDENKFLEICWTYYHEVSYTF